MRAGESGNEQGETEDTFFVCTADEDRDGGLGAWQAGPWQWGGLSGEKELGTERMRRNEEIGVCVCVSKGLFVNIHLGTLVGVMDPCIPFYLMRR